MFSNEETHVQLYSIGKCRFLFFGGFSIFVQQSVDWYEQEVQPVFV